MENFNLKKFLVENKLTANSRMLNENANEVEHRGYIIRPNEYNYGNKPGTKYEFYNTNDPDQSMGQGSSVEDCKQQIDELLADRDMEVIDGWYFSTNPQADELSPEEVEAGVQAHYEEWNAVKDQYNSIDDYFEDIERNGDWY